MFVKKLCMKETCSNGVMGQTFMPGMNGQSGIFPSIDILIADWNMPKRVMNRKAPIPRARNVFFIESIAISIPESPSNFKG